MPYRPTHILGPTLTPVLCVSGQRFQNGGRELKLCRGGGRRNLGEICQNFAGFWSKVNKNLVSTSPEGLGGRSDSLTAFTKKHKAWRAS